MTTMISDFHPGDRTENGLPLPISQNRCALRYRSVAYRCSDLPRALPVTCDGMIYRGFRYRASPHRPGLAPAAGQRRYRGVDF